MASLIDELEIGPFPNVFGRQKTKGLGAHGLLFV